MPDLQALLDQSRARHSHLCPRQVLGVRMALAGAACLGLSLPRKDKNLLVIAETDGCFVDGLEVTAGVSVGHRTLRVEDYGKVAATFVDVTTAQAVRLAPRQEIRQQAQQFAPTETQHYFAQLYAYQVMAEEKLFSFRPVALAQSLEQIVSRPGLRVTCAVCGEEIMNEREVIHQGFTYCRSCFEPGYYHSKESTIPLATVIMSAR